jgi:hypothetical protein
MSELPKPEVIAENILSIEGGDKLESGLLIVNVGPDERPVAYAKLGDTTVSISRNLNGDVTVEIDDTSDEDVFVSCNLQTLRAYPESDRAPWHSEE